jgi:hypothetical protein
MEQLIERIEKQDALIKILIENKNKMNKKTSKDSIFIDLNFVKLNTFANAYRWTPCLNTQPGLWNMKLHRYANVNEYLKLLLSINPI